MELLIGRKKANTWTRCKGIFHGLRHAVQLSAEILLFCASPIAECENLVSAIW